MRYKVSLIRVDLPEPETPVTTTNEPRGMCTSFFLRLFPRAQRSLIKLPLAPRLSEGIGIPRRPDKYCPVIENLLLLISSGVPDATIFPPCTPAPGPKSTT